MQRLIYALSLLTLGAPAFAAQCEVTRVDKTPVYFLGPSGQFPHVGAKFAVDLAGNSITENIEFEEWAKIPIKDVGVVLERKKDFHPFFPEEGQLVPHYFDGQFVSPSGATYTLAIHVDAKGVGQLQISRRGFLPQLELYNADLSCTL